MSALAVPQVLRRPVLVLNRHFQAIATTSVQEAISLVAKGGAVILDPETYETHLLDSWDAVSKAREKFEGRVIRSTTMTLVEPEVILLKSYDGQGERSVVFSRRNIYKRDKYTCQYCGKQPPVNELTIDHLIPKSKRGKSDWLNCVLACFGCNTKKANKTLAEAKMTLRRQPVKPSWTSISQIGHAVRRESWKQFLDKAYWTTELLP